MIELRSCLSVSTKIVTIVTASENKEIINMQNDKAIEENAYVSKQVLEQVGTPSGYLFSKALNVYDNKYRVNVYTRVMRGENKDLEGMSISQSYFVRLDDNTVTILS